MLASKADRKRSWAGCTSRGISIVVRSVGNARGAIGRARATIGGWLWVPVLGRLALWLCLFVALAHVGAGTVGRLLGLTPTAAAAERLLARDQGSWSGPATAGAPDGLPEGCGPDGGPGDGGAADGGVDRDAGAPPARLPDGRVVLNAATAADLVTLPGIGPKRADAILALRSRLGRFRRIEDLRRVRGIGPKAVARLRPLVVVDFPDEPSGSP